MDSSVKVGILEMSSANVNSTSVEEVELQIFDPNSSKMTPNSQSNDNRTNRDSQVGSTKEETVANNDAKLNIIDSTCVKEPEDEADTITKGNFGLIIHNMCLRY